MEIKSFQIPAFPVMIPLGEYTVGSGTFASTASFDITTLHWNKHGIAEDILVDTG